MKINLLITCLAILISSCTKDSDSSSREADNNSTASVSSLKYYPVSAGGNVSVRFDVTFNMPNPGEIKKVNLYRLPNLLLDNIDNPEGKSYVMYDHVIDVYPTYSSSTFYQFEFITNSGQKILIDKFQVY